MTPHDALMISIGLWFGLVLTLAGQVLYAGIREIRAMGKRSRGGYSADPSVLPEAPQMAPADYYKPVWGERKPYVAPTLTSLGTKRPSGIYRIVYRGSVIGLCAGRDTDQLS